MHGQINCAVHSFRPFAVLGACFPLFVKSEHLGYFPVAPREDPMLLVEEQRAEGVYDVGGLD